MDEYIVYIRIDERNRIIEVNSSAFITPTEEWIEVDHGNGDKYHHAQGNYFDKPIYEEHGVPVFKYINGHTAPRTENEIQRDIDAIPAPEPSQADRTEAQALYTAMMTDTLLEE